MLGLKEEPRFQALARWEGRFFQSCVWKWWSSKIFQPWVMAISTGKFLIARWMEWGNQPLAVRRSPNNRWSRLIHPYPVWWLISSQLKLLIRGGSALGGCVFYPHEKNAMCRWDFTCRMMPGWVKNHGNIWKSETGMDIINVRVNCLELKSTHIHPLRQQHVHCWDVPRDFAPSQTW
jgi:hypothetical protein